MLQEILHHYKKRFPFDKFYDNLFFNIEHWPKYHIQNNLFLKGYPLPIRQIEFEEQKIACAGNIRVDLPIWFSDPRLERRIVIVGLEPRNTDTFRGHLNIEHRNNYVFATPFALERPKGVYHKAFLPLTENPKVFSYFTDVVKEYEVLDAYYKQINDRRARQLFIEKAEAGKEFLLQELLIIKPTEIIALGESSHKFLSKIVSNEIRIHRFRHPSYGGSIICKRQIEELLK